MATLLVIYVALSRHLNISTLLIIYTFLSHHFNICQFVVADWDSDDDEDVEDDDEDSRDVEGATPLSSDGEGDQCPICLNRFREQDVGTPESCDHDFCLECILEWSKVCNQNAAILCHCFFYEFCIQNS